MSLSGPHKRNYTTVSNPPINDERLSWEALGLLLYLLSRPSDWRIHVRHLCSVRRSGRDRMYRMVNELVAAGYIVREVVRSRQRIVSVEYVVTDQPDGSLAAGTSPANATRVSDSPSAPAPPVSQHPGFQDRGKIRTVYSYLKGNNPLLVSRSAKRLPPAGLMRRREFADAWRAWQQGRQDFPDRRRESEAGEARLVQAQRG